MFTVSFWKRSWVHARKEWNVVTFLIVPKPTTT